MRRNKKKRGRFTLGAASPAAASPAAATVPGGFPAGAAGSLRQRYPFLDEPGCPAELHALVGHRISLYHEYTRLYRQLPDCTTPEECASVAGRLLDAYLSNRQATEELDHYRQHRKVLGRHPFLRQFAQNSRLRGMTTRQLFDERQRTRDNIWRAQREIEKADKPHLLAARRQRIEQYQLKLAEINRLLGGS